jgi:hypothetical protein
MTTDRTAFAGRGAYRVFLLAASFVAVCGPASGAEVIDRVLAVVNGTVITLSDVTAARELGLVRVDEAADPVGAVLSGLIDRMLELIEVDRYAPPEPSAEAIDRQLEVVRERLGTQPALDAALTRWGLDVQHLREWLRDDLRIRAYLDQRFVAAPERRQRLIAEWLAALRRRAELTDLYLSER